MKLRWIILGVILILIILIGVLGLFFYKSYCKENYRVTMSIDEGISKAVKDAFSDPDKKLIIYPTERDIEIEKGTSKEGFGFSIRNVLNESSSFRFIIGIDQNFDIEKKCETSISEAESYLMIDSGIKNIDALSIMDSPELIKINIPKNASECTIIYKIEVMNNNTFYSSSKVYVDIIPKKNFIIRFKEYLGHKFNELIC